MQEYLAGARETEPFFSDELDEELFEPEEIEDMSREDIRDCTRDLLLVERAKEWLLED